MPVCFVKSRSTDFETANESWVTSVIVVGIGAPMRPTRRVRRPGEWRRRRAGVRADASRASLSVLGCGFGRSDASAPAPGMHGEQHAAGQRHPGDRCRRARCSRRGSSRGAASRRGAGSADPAVTTPWAGPPSGRRVTRSPGSARELDRDRARRTPRRRRGVPRCRSDAKSSDGEHERVGEEVVEPPARAADARRHASAPRSRAAEERELEVGRVLGGRVALDRRARRLAPPTARRRRRSRGRRRRRRRGSPRRCAWCSPESAAITDRVARRGHARSSTSPASGASPPVNTSATARP